MSYASGQETNDAQVNSGPSSAQGANGTGNADNKLNLNLDSHLSSMRSSVPDLQFGGDNTLASVSATASPSHHDTAASILQAQAQGQGQGTPGSASSAHLGGDSLLVPQNPTIEGLKDTKGQPFSRSPELRVSHKLAERKRRKEMKDMFDELKDLLPSERASKWSKWEILSKGIDYLEHLKKDNENLHRHNAMLQREIAHLKGENPNDTYAPPTYSNYSTVGLGGSGNNNANANAAADSMTDPALLAADSQQQQGQASGEDQEMGQAAVGGQNEDPLDTDAIRESLTQVGERIDKLDQ